MSLQLYTCRLLKTPNRSHNMGIRFCAAAIIILISLAGSACAQTTADTVIVLPLKIAAPANAKKLGTIKAGNNATTSKCDYVAVIADAKRKAAKMGGNMVKITELISPAFVGKCYKIQADVYTIHPLPQQLVQKPVITEPTDSNAYARLYIYRLRDSLALEPTYSVHMNKDSVICRVSSRSRNEVRVYTTGKITLWAETEGRRELTLDIKPGEVYYIRCGLAPGEVRMVPVLELVDKASGAAQYGPTGGKKNGDVNYLQQIH